MRSAFGLVLLLSLAACPNTDPAVFVEPVVTNPSCAVTGSSSLGYEVKGGFTLSLHLGARASGSSSVQVQSFSIVDASHDSVIDPLKLTADKMLPVTVDQDSTVVVSLSFDTAPALLMSDVIAKLCAGDMFIQGTIDDSLENRGTPVTSGPFRPTGCP